MARYVGLDVSLKSTAICVVEANGTVVFEGKAPSDPPSLAKALSKWRDDIALVGIEACPLSEWLYGGLQESGFPIVCIEARHAHRFLSTRPVKTDRNDARGIADMMRLDHFRAVHVKSKSSLMVRTTLMTRRKFVEEMVSIEQSIRGLLKVHGIKIGAVHRCTFAKRVEDLLADNAELLEAIKPLLETRNVMRRQKIALDRSIAQQARKNEICRRLMTIPGVGPITSLAFVATIDDPVRFKASKAVAAHLGLTPRVYQSGEIDRTGHISKWGDRMLRHLLYEAANSHMRIAKTWSTLKAWGLKLARRIGVKKALVGVARKLAIIMHQIWVSGRTFEFGKEAPMPAAA